MRTHKRYVWQIAAALGVFVPAGAVLAADLPVKAPPIDYITNAFPSAMGVTVVSAAGAPVPGVTIELFPVEWFSRTVGGTPVLTGVTDSKGELLFQVNPFEPNSPGFPWNIHYSNLLVRATAGGNRSYMWLPLTAAQVGEAGVRLVREADQFERVLSGHCRRYVVGIETHVHEFPHGERHGDIERLRQIADQFRAVFVAYGIDIFAPEPYGAG